MSDPITERIKKLLRLAADKRGNPHEAERALALAFELAEKHRVDVESLDLDEKSAELMHEHIAVGFRFDRMKRLAFGIVQTYFHVSLVMRGPRMIIVGRREDVVVAQYIYDFLRRVGRDCLSAFAKSEKALRRRMTTNKRASFIAGFFYGISETLNKARKATPLSDSTRALIVSEKSNRAAYIEQEVGVTGKLKALPERRNETALTSGYLRGRETTINQPLSGPSQLYLK